MAIETTRVPNQVRIAIPAQVRMVEFLRSHAVYVALIVAVVVFSVVAPAFVTVNTLVDILRLAATTGIVAIALFVVLVAGGFDLSVSEVASVSGMVFGALVAWQHMNVEISIVAALVAGPILGLVNGLLVAKAKIVPFIATLGTAFVFRSMGMVLGKGTTITGLRSPVFSFIGQGNVGPVPMSVVILIVLALVGYVLTTRTVFGRHAFACGGNVRAANLSGVNTNRIKITTYIISGGLAAVVGLIVASRSEIASPSMGGIPGFSFLLMDALAALMIAGVSIFGGQGTLQRAMVGVLVVATVTQGMALVGATATEHTIVKGLIILFAIALQRKEGGS